MILLQPWLCNLLFNIIFKLGNLILYGHFDMTTRFKVKRVSKKDFLEQNIEHNKKESLLLIMHAEMVSSIKIKLN